MELSYKVVGEKGPALIILHGLYGSSDNWISIARQLSGSFKVILIDQRNHGNSPHVPEHNYQHLANDLAYFFEQHAIEKAHLIGHSMGGKTAMAFALLHPEKVERLVIADIAPKSYASFSNYGISTNNHALILNTLAELPLEQCQSREEIDAILSQKLPDKGLRQFLLKNVTRNDQNVFCWKINVPVLQEHLDEIMDGFSNTGLQKLQFLQPVIFIRGEKSGYVQDDDVLGIRRMFPKAELVTIPNAGHWLHAEQPDLFVKTALYFLED